MLAKASVFRAGHCLQDGSALDLVTSLGQQHHSVSEQTALHIFCQVRSTAGSDAVSRAAHGSPSSTVMGWLSGDVAAECGCQKSHLPISHLCDNAAGHHQRQPLSCMPVRKMHCVRTSARLCLMSRSGSQLLTVSWPRCCRTLQSSLQPALQMCRCAKGCRLCTPSLIALYTVTSRYGLPAHEHTASAVLAL